VGFVITKLFSKVSVSTCAKVMACGGIQKEMEDTGVVIRRPPPINNWLDARISRLTFLSVERENLAKLEVMASAFCLAQIVPRRYCTVHVPILTVSCRGTCNRTQRPRFGIASPVTSMRLQYLASPRASKCRRALSQENRGKTNRTNC
jgi:hypothetical protein